VACKTKKVLYYLLHAFCVLGQA